MKIQAKYNRYNHMMRSDFVLCTIVSLGLLLVPLVIQAVHGS